MAEVIPGILATSEGEYKTLSEKVGTSGISHESWVQIDFADNKFVQNLTVGADIVRKYPLKMKKEAHLMVADPWNWIKGLKGSSFERVIFHQEAGKTKETIQAVRDAGMGVGLAIDIDTPAENLQGFLGDIDVALVMSIHAGFGGQKFMPEVLDKIKWLSMQRTKNGYRYTIEVDGGVHPGIAKGLAAAGADCLVVGAGRLLENGHETLEQIRQEING